MPPPKVCQASAGSDLIGCHSAAVDADGRLFTWGVGAAAGHASLKPVLLPRSAGSIQAFLAFLGIGLLFLLPNRHSYVLHLILDRSLRGCPFERFMKHASTFCQKNNDGKVFAMYGFGSAAGASSLLYRSL